MCLCSGYSGVDLNTNFNGKVSLFSDFFLKTNDCMCLSWDVVQGVLYNLSYLFFLNFIVRLYEERVSVNLKCLLSDWL